MWPGQPEGGVFALWRGNILTSRREGGKRASPPGRPRASSRSTKRGQKLLAVGRSVGRFCPDSLLRLSSAGVTRKSRDGGRGPSISRATLPRMASGGAPRTGMFARSSFTPSNGAPHGCEPWPGLTPTSSLPGVAGAGGTSGCILNPVFLTLAGRRLTPAALGHRPGADYFPGLLSGLSHSSDHRDQAAVQRHRFPA